MNRSNWRVGVGMLLGASLIGCQGNNVGGGERHEMVQSPKTLKANVSHGEAKPQVGGEPPDVGNPLEGQSTQAQQDAELAFKNGDKRLIGVQTRGVSIPGVRESVIAVVRERYGISLRPVSDVIRNDEDRKTLTEVFQYVRQYNSRIAELLVDEL